MNDRHAISPYPIRMPQEIRDHLEERAKKAGRSLHAEIMQRLEATIALDEFMAEIKVGTFADAHTLWFSAAHVASALGLRSSDRITRSALPQELCQTLRGKQAMNYLAPQAALRAGDYAVPEAGERWCAWFQRTLEGLAQQPLQHPAPEAPELTAVERFGLEQLLNTRLLLGFNATGGLEVKAVKPDAMVVTPDRLATVIGDNFVIGQQHLPEILSAVAGRMRSVA
ncbi:Arc family DNA-binding protein [Stutzerimonas nitrititolerans]|uniref:Arc family DNA-binding protein n=1 Tax=Stutzerimonas nitrititolerans TaxID=2482751 RepID=UPI0028AB1807|nr:Arc family DNA-binding protein [Stutzerimonas nitrititolerans]